MGPFLGLRGLRQLGIIRLDSIQHKKERTRYLRVHVYHPIYVYPFPPLSVRPWALSPYLIFLTLENRVQDQSKHQVVWTTLETKATNFAATTGNFSLFDGKTITTKTTTSIDLRARRRNVSEQAGLLISQRHATDSQLDDYNCLLLRKSPAELYGDKGNIVVFT